MIDLSLSAKLFISENGAGKLSNFFYYLIIGILSILVLSKLLPGAYFFFRAFNLSLLLSSLRKASLRRQSQKAPSPSILENRKIWLFSERGRDSRIALSVLLVGTILFLPVISSIYLVAVAITEFSVPDQSVLTDFWAKYGEHLLFASGTLGAVGMVSVFAARYLYAYLICIAGSEGYGAVSLFFKSLAALPATFLGISFIMAIKAIGWDADAFLTPYTVWMFLCIGTMPNIMMLIVDEAPITARYSDETVNQGIALGDGVLAACFKLVVETKETTKFLFWVAIWSSARIMAELGILNVLSANGPTLNLKDFVLDLLGNYGPSNLGGFVVVMLAIAAISLAFSFVRG